MSVYRRKLPGGRRETREEHDARLKREAREMLEELISQGKLVIRQATAEERIRFGIRAKGGGEA